MTHRALGWLCAVSLLAGGVFADSSATAQETPEAAPAPQSDAPAAATPEATASDPNALRVRFGFEGKAHFRDSESFRFPSPFPFPPEALPPGATQGGGGGVNEGQHFEISVLTLLVD